ncbi:hypothetical protein D9M73_120560 [compost metagenome]
MRRALTRFLQDRIDYLRLGWRDRLGKGRNRLGPFCADRRLILHEQRLFPEQADRQKTGHRVVVAPGKLGLPPVEPRILCPSAQSDQQPVEIGLERGLGQAEPPRGSRDGVSGIAVRIRYKGGKTAQPDDLRREVMRRDGSPGGIGALAARCSPQRLTLIEIAPGPGTEALGKDARPIDSCRIRRQIGDRRQGHEFGARLLKGQFERRHRRRALWRAGVFPCRCQIGVGNHAPGDLIAIPAAWHRHRRSRNPPEQRCGLGKITVGLSEIRIYRDAGSQRPDRGNGQRSSVGSGMERVACQD